MLSIQTQLDEIYNIQIEIKSLQSRIKGFKTRKSFLEDNIIKYLNKSGQDSITYKNITFDKSEIAHRGYKKKKDKHTDIKTILYNEGVRNPSKVLDDIIYAQKGKITNKQKLSYSKKK